MPIPELLELFNKESLSWSNDTKSPVADELRAVLNKMRGMKYSAESLGKYYPPGSKDAYWRSQHLSKKFHCMAQESLFFHRGTIRSVS